MQSKQAAWLAFVLVLVYMVVTFKFRMEIGWWMYIDIFFIFMAAFMNLLICYLRKINPFVARKLNTFAFLFGLLFLVALIAEWAIFLFA